MNIHMIINIVSEETGVPVDFILSSMRNSAYVDARRLLWLLLYEDGNSVQEIAIMFDLDRSTVHTGIARIKELATLYATIKTQYTHCKGRVVV